MENIASRMSLVIAMSLLTETNIDGFGVSPLRRNRGFMYLTQELSFVVTLMMSLVFHWGPSI